MNHGAMLDDQGPVPAPDKFRVGTLAYTKWSLVIACTWLLWGDFCFHLFETVLPKLLPMQLRDLGGSNWIIGIACTTIPAAMRLVVGPVVSFRSDRHRGRWGRRRPFLMIGTPFVAASLFLLGFAPELGGSVYRFLGERFSPRTVTIATVVALVVAYHFFNTFIATVYFYLFNDVVPRAFLGRVMSAFRFVSVLAGAAFSAFIFPMAKTHLREIYMGSAVLLLVMFGMMILKVREGEYPPPRELIGRRKGVIAAMHTYFIECFTSRRYWYFFLAATLWALGLSIFSLDLFWAQSLGATMKQYGWLCAVEGVLIAVLILPSGILADRIHPLRVMLISKAILMAVCPFYLIFVFMGEAPSWGFWAWAGLQLISVPMTALYKAVEIPMAMRILPRDQYGQFSSAAEMVKSLTLIVGGPLSGLFIDWLARHSRVPMWEYRFVPLWAMVFQGLSLIFLYLLYRELMRGGRLDSQDNSPQAVGAVA